MSTNADNDQPNDFNQAVLVLQIICASLMFGVIVFGGFTLLQKSDALAKKPSLTYFALIEAIVVIPLCLFIPRLVSKASQAKTRNIADNGNSESSQSSQSQIAPLQIQKIIQYAMLEGSAFLNLVAYYIECHPLALLAVALILIIMVVIFPTHASVTRWLRERREIALFDDKSFA